MRKLITLSESDVSSLRIALEYICESEVDDFEAQLKDRGVSYSDDYSTRSEFEAQYCQGNKPKWHIFQNAMALLLDLNQTENQ